MPSMSLPDLGRAAKAVGAILGVVAMIGGGVATCTGWASKAIRAPEQIERVYERQEAIIQYLALDYCERQGISHTACDPGEIPGPGGQ